MQDADNIVAAVFSSHVARLTSHPTTLSQHSLAPTSLILNRQEVRHCSQPYTAHYSSRGSNLVFQKFQN